MAVLRLNPAPKLEKCSRCDKPMFRYLNGQPLCLDCFNDWLNDRPVYICHNCIHHYLPPMGPFRCEMKPELCFVSPYHPPCSLFKRREKDE